MRCSDPYDLWAIPVLGRLKQRWSDGGRKAGLLLPLIGLFEFVSPRTLRHLLRVKQHRYAHVEAMLILREGKADQRLLADLKELRLGEVAWGLPFDWFSKNGVYCKDTAYVTNTPYVMEALLYLASCASLHDEAMDMFHATWGFLESLRIMKIGQDDLALSYAPVQEPRIVINANAYAAYAYAMHARHGRPNIQEYARDKAGRIVRWITRERQAEGSWFYYADKEPGNFIDCFHSCFVMKNLKKTMTLIPETSSVIEPALERGWNYIRCCLFDERAGLCRRFAVQARHDPFRWDLYDQAEYLGLLVDHGLVEEGAEFAERVEKAFRKGEHWYCRIDMFGRRWGKDFLRWGIVPFWYHKSRLDRLLQGVPAECAE